VQCGGSRFRCAAENPKRIPGLHLRGLLESGRHSSQARIARIPSNRATSGVAAAIGWLRHSSANRVLQAAMTLFSTLLTWDTLPLLIMARLARKLRLTDYFTLAFGTMVVLAGWW